MITCDSCQTSNAPEAKFCEHCGSQLGAAPVEPPAEVEPTASPASSGADMGSMTMVGSVASLPQIDEELAKSVKAFLVIERGDHIGVKFGLTDKESLIGRWDADNGIFPEIDLDRFDAEAKVSRRHAKVYMKDGQFVIEDLGSTNGTFLNRGRRLLPGVPQVLANDDELIIGKTFLRFKIG